LPEWRDVQFNEGQPLRFTAEVITKPEVQLGNYKGLKLKRAKVKSLRRCFRKPLRKFAKIWLATNQPMNLPRKGIA
jgi:FKBP-type peptidyl-prolyl cis-trans isomerase (trigger factor)